MKILLFYAGDPKNLLLKKLMESDVLSFMKVSTSDSRQVYRYSRPQSRSSLLAEPGLVREEQVALRTHDLTG